nr:unnamed protein product [Digitaria exilis]
MAMAAGVACDYCREDQLEMECCRGGLLPRSTGLLPDDGAEEEVDRISAMPDDLLLQILAGLGCARAAAHTGLLARRWRGLWARLPRLTFHCVVPGLLGAALAMVAGDPTPPSLIDIHFSDHHMIEPARITSLLAAAAALAPEEFVFHIGGGIPPGPVMLPCFDRTTSIKLDLTYAHFTLPSAGGFPALESLHLENCHMDINDMLRRCPRLRKLRVLDWNSESVVVALTALEELAVRATVQIRRINIVAPALKKLYLDAHCGIHKEFSLSFSAPAVEDFIWKFIQEMQPPLSKRYTDFKLPTFLFWSWISSKEGMFMAQSSCIYLAFVPPYKGLRRGRDALKIAAVIRPTTGEVRISP